MSTARTPADPDHLPEPISSASPPSSAATSPAATSPAATSPAAGSPAASSTVGPSPTSSPRHRLPAVIRATRPRQWVKNVLVFAAPLAAGRLIETDVLWRTAAALVAFCLASAAVYLINDVRDVAEDRLHPTKRLRPIAAGELSASVAVILACCCAVISLAIGFVVAIPLGVTLLIYLLLQLIYSGWLKHLPIIDLAMVASGFLLRAVAGGVASNIPLSQWFLLVASFGSLFMVAGKRYSELVALGAEAGTRRSLERYTVSYLRFAWMLAAAMVIMSYSLWAFDNAHNGPWGVPWSALSIAPLTLGLLQYAREIDTGAAGEPEQIVLHDHVLQVLGLLWAVLVAIGVFG